ncbi:hypothetical protein ACJW31_02G114200 [Castanea mollissima]
MQTAVEPHDSENRDQTTSHDSLLPFESEPKKKKKNTKYTHTHTHTHKTSFKLYSLQSTSRSSLSLETLLLGEASFKLCHYHRTSDRYQLKQEEKKQKRRVCH